MSNVYGLTAVFVLYKSVYVTNLVGVNMKAALNLVSALTFLAFSVSVAISAPRTTVDRSSYDFGTVAQGKHVEHVFILKNIGDAPLTIGQVTTSCGCTVADVSSRTVASGKTSDIRVSFNSAGFSGAVTKRIMVQTNDPKTPVFTFTLKGTVFEEIDVTPKQLNLGAIKAGTGKEAVINIENKGKQPITITSARSTMPQVVAKVKKRSVTPRAKTTVDITVSPRPDDRFLGGYLIISTNSASKPEIMIPVYANVVK